MNNTFSSLNKKSLAMQLGVILCLFLLGLFTSAVFIALLNQYSFFQSHAYLNQVAMLGISSIGTFLLPSLLWILMNRGDGKSDLRILFPKNSSIFLWSFLLVFIALPFVQYVAFFNQQIPLPSALIELEKKANEQLQSLLQSRTSTSILINILLIGILPAIVEELFFRSVLQKTIYNSIKKVWISILIAAFIFSFLHFQFLGFFPRFVLGIFLGILFQYSNSILPSMLFHATFNTFQLVLYYSVNIDLDKMNQQHTNVWALSIVAAISLVGIYFVVRKKIISPQE